MSPLPVYGNMHQMTISAHFHVDRKFWCLRRGDLSFKTPDTLSLADFFVAQAMDFHWERFQSDEWEVVTGFYSGKTWPEMLTIDLEYAGDIQEREFITTRFKAKDRGLLGRSDNYYGRWHDISRLEQYIRNRVSLMEQEAIQRILSESFA